MSLNGYISRQFGDPTGLGGRLVASVMNRQNRPLYEETLGLLRPSDPDNILDIGCGNGYVLNMLASRCRGVLTGIDASESILRAAAHRNHVHIKSGRMRLFCQDAGAMTFEDRSFDKAYAINTVYFWKDLNGVMNEIGRVLRPGGLFVNALYTNETLSRLSHTKYGYNRYAPEQLIGAGADAGLTADTVTVLNGAAYCILYTKPNL